MDKNHLIAAGLTPIQAMVYIYVLEHGTVNPPKLATDLKLTRSNAYKVLDKLVEQGVVSKTDQNKKFVYTAGNPLSLTNLVAEQRNIATQREEAVKSVLNDLLKTYYEHTDIPHADVATGKDAVIQAYKNQLLLKKPVYFIRSRADISSIGFEAMHEIRTTPAIHNVQRYVINPDVTSGPVNPAINKRSNLTQTWVKNEDYTAPVEWSVSGHSLLIVIFGNEPHAVTIVNPMVAEAFRQLWKLLDVTLRSMPYYKTLPRTTDK